MAAFYVVAASGVPEIDLLGIQTNVPALRLREVQGVCLGFSEDLFESKPHLARCNGSWEPTDPGAEPWNRDTSNPWRARVRYRCRQDRFHRQVRVDRLSETQRDTHRRRGRKP